MITFIIGLAILIVGSILYGTLCEKVFRPDDRKTPAVAMTDGIDYVPLPRWRNCLIQLLNIAGTGPILGPIQGILFGPIAFITIPVGCVIGGAMHDYMSAMISVRNGGAQMPSLVRKYLGKVPYVVFSIVVAPALLLAGTVFTYVPGDLIVSQFMPKSINPAVIWIVYGVIFAYYFLATLLPIDKIIGKIYPIFGLLLLLSSVGVLGGILLKGYPLDELWNIGVIGVHPQGLHFFPVFFVTVACGIVSGFHSTQSTLISRTLRHEKDGKAVFYFMMIAEGLIAMIWAAAAMGVMNMNLADTATSPTDVVGVVAKNMLGTVGGTVAILGVIVLPITSGDTALRAMRVSVAEVLHLKQKSAASRLLLSAVIFACACGILIFAKTNANGFGILWRYFGFANQLIAVFVFSIISVYLMKHGKTPLMSIIPGAFYAFIVIAFITNADIGFRLPYTASLIIGGVAACAFIIATVLRGQHEKKLYSGRTAVREMD